MSKISPYIPRELTRIKWKEATPEGTDPRSIVIEIDDGSSKGRFMDIGAICYTGRINFNGARCKHVIESTFRPDRLKAARSLLDYVTSMETSSSAYTNYGHIMQLFNHIDENKIEVDFSNAESILELYENLTDHLLYRMQQHELSDKKISRIHASILQRRWAEFLSLISKKHFIEIQSSCMVIDQKGKTGKQPEPFEKQKRVFATHLEIFHSISKFLTSRSPFPLVIEADNQKAIYYSQQGPTSAATQIACKERYLDWKEVQHEAKRLNITLQPNSQRTWKAFKDNFKDYNHEELSWRGINLANKAIQAFQMAFLAVTTGNSSVVFDLTLDESNTTPLMHSKGKRFTGMKRRAGKIVPLEFSLRFKPHYDSYIKFRKWLLQNIKSETRFLFFHVDALKISNRKGHNFFGPKISQCTTANIETYKQFFVRYFPKTPWLTPTLLRKGGGDYFLSATADPVTTANKLGNTVTTVLKHYSRTSFEHASHELTKFFGEMHNRVVSDTRDSEKTIPVTILESGGSETATGHCENQAHPQLAKGFTEKAPQPFCDIPESCLFCQHYAIHADVKDIKKILSLEEVIKNTLQKAFNHDHANAIGAPILHRISEILDELVTRYPFTFQLINSTQDEITQGNLDEFWGIHYDFLVQAGYIT